jgi:hypothetical protein
LNEKKRIEGFKATRVTRFSMEKQLSALIVDFASPKT